MQSSYFYLLAIKSIGLASFISFILRFGKRKNPALDVANMKNLRRKISTQYNLDRHPNKCSQRPTEDAKPIFSLLNRYSRYEFILSPEAPTKFMDDFLIETPSLARQNINLYRQIR